VKTPAGGFKDDVPVAYQDITGVRKNVALSYKLHPQDGGNEEVLADQDAVASAHIYGFEVGDYDPAQTLILDPALFVFAGFIGGNMNDGGHGIAVDSVGNVYVTGIVGSSDGSFPQIVGPDLSFNGNHDVFVAKVDASGTALVYCGYIGGSDWDEARSIAVDASGNAYLTGFTLSTQTTFPVVAGYDMTHNGLNDAFVAKVNAAGDALVYCTYIGGSADDYAYDIAVDGSGNAYISGYTGSSEATFCEITGPDLTFNGGTYDAFVCKLNSSGTGRYYCGYIGGSADDYGRGIAVDGPGNAYVVGTTSSSEASFPETVGPDLSINGSSDIFIGKLNSGGLSFIYCGYIGGTGEEYGNGIALDSQGNAYLAGYGGISSNFPAVVGPDLTFNGWGYYDAIVAKVKMDGTGLDYCGYIGGTNVDYGNGIAVDSSGNAYVLGYAQSDPAAGFPVLIGPDLTLNGGSDAFIAKVNASGSKLIYCGYIGGDGVEYAVNVAADTWGNAYVTGYINSGANFPATVGPDLSHNGYHDALVAKIYYYWAPGPKTSAVGDFDGDATMEAAFDLGTNGAWMYDSGTWTQLSTMNPEGMITANVDGNADDELFMEFGYGGLWLWDGGAMDLLSEEDVETMAAGDVDGDNSDELVVDFGAVGLWLYNGGAWNQLSGVNLENMVVANMDGSGGAEITGDFGTVGLWSWSGGTWTQLSGVNVENMVSGNTDGAGGKDLIGDFGPVGLWLFSNNSWEQWSGVNADYMIAADIDGNGDDEVFGDFSGTGLWLWDGGVWTIFSGLDVEYMLAVDTDGDGSDEMVADFGTIGVWHWDSGAWNQISGVDTESLLASDIDNDGADEVFADFGTLGLWLWNGGVWSQISAMNPD